MTGWSFVLERAAEIANGRNAIRLTNLALAVCIATDQSHPDGQRLRDRVDGLTVSGPLHCDDSLLAWQALADEAGQSARRLRGSNAHDHWVQAFQAADPARKSRGAYATPEALARPMARLLLGNRTPARILDPSAGGGALLLACYHHLTGRRPSRDEQRRAVSRLHGIELDPVARELCCLQIWLASRDAVNIQTIAGQIHHDNAITCDWTHGPYDALIMNPPWDSLRHSDDADDQERRRTIERIEQPAASGTPLPALFSRQGRGDRNLYKAFVEMAPHLVDEGGHIVALLPGAWASDLGTQELRELYLAHTEVRQWTSFENRRGYFPIDGRYKFGILHAVRNSVGSRTIRVLGMADDVRQLAAKHVTLPAPAVRRIGGPAAIIPDLVDRDEAALLRQISGSGLPFFEKHPGLGQVRYEREVDLTEDRKRGLFDRLEAVGAQPDGKGSWTDKDGRSLRPLVEGRMVGQYDFYEKSWVSGSGRTAAWSYNNGHGIDACRPQFLAPPAEALRSRIAICDVTSATNTRTVLAAWVPADWRCGNTAPVLVFDDEQCALAALAVLNSMIFDWQARRIVSGLHLNRFYLQAMSWPQLNQSEVEELAAAATALLNFSPRFRDIAPPRLVGTIDASYVDLHAVIEEIVADGYRLSDAQRARVYDPSDGERRGFWRHYASDPHALEIAQRMGAHAIA